MALSPLSLARTAAWRTARSLFTMRGHCTDQELAAAVRGKTVLLTGASFGIGEATARRLGAAGATVLLVARSDDRLREVAGSITAAGGEAHGYPADLTDGPAVQALVEQVLDKHGHVDVLVNNAGRSIRRSVEDSYDRAHDYERTMAINYLGPVRLTLGLLPSMRERRSGHVVSVATHGVAPGMPAVPLWGAYLSSKVAFDWWLRTMALEAKGDGVTATSVYMGLVHTRMSAPSPSVRQIPGISPATAAGVLCDAIVRRPKSMEPLWTKATSAATTMLSGPIDLALSKAFQRGRAI
ncbi:SDR family NAD(P)-dependent oxidoreductase [Amycolatopsis nigrescens]|uniref:SDR family NAD(P)-dependent oxidoreductase n=1 Tax=Amycolatopsis nigrescens TaxID=381445 RepID=UPI00036FF126|nr:SDR family NAD(P)-dependent oxidoreductase [Amycolatopsis nigrescens]